MHVRLLENKACIQFANTSVAESSTFYSYYGVANVRYYGVANVHQTPKKNYANKWKCIVLLQGAVH